MRSSYYDRAGNEPPPSPTAKWKDDVHRFEDLARTDPNRHPYLPDPYPLKRAGRARGGHPGGFTSLQEPRRPPKFPDEDQLYMTYAEWWHAQRPPLGPPDDKDKTFSTSYWPFGRRISCVASMDNEDQYYNLDKRIIKNHSYYKDRREPPSSQFPVARSQSSSELLGSQAEHFGYNKALGQTATSHSSAAFHERSRRFATSGSSPALSGSRNMWDSMRSERAEVAMAARASSASSGQRAASDAGSTARSFEAQAGSSRYDPKQSLRGLGLGQRTHAEWCLPQPVYASP